MELPMQGRSAVERVKTLVGAVVVATSLVVLVRFIRFGPWNPDEFQHAHIAWRTLRGTLIYRDFFEHHGPLFAAWNALFLRVSQSSPGFDALERLRWLNAAVLVATGVALFRLGLRLTGTRSTALACAAVYGASPVVTWIGVQPRPDALVGLSLLAALERLVSRRPLAAGLWLGTAVGLHPKAVLMGAGLAGAVAVAWAFEPGGRTARRLGATLGRFAAGAVAVPLGLASFFLLVGARRPFIDGVWSVNATALLGRLTQGAGAPHSHGLLWETGAEAVLVFGFALALRARATLLRGSRTPAARWLVPAAALAMAVFALLPSHPHILLIVLPFVALAPAIAPPSTRRLVTVLALGAALVGMTRSIRRTPDREPAFAVEQRRLVDRILREARPDEPVAYVWPSVCAAYVFQPDPAWMWMLGRDAQRARDVSYLEQRALDDERRVFDRLRVGELRWVAADPNLLGRLPPEDAAYLRSRFDRDGCLWKRRPDGS